MIPLVSGWCGSGVDSFEHSQQRRKQRTSAIGSHALLQSLRVGWTIRSCPIVAFGPVLHGTDHLRAYNSARNML